MFKRFTILVSLLLIAAVLPVSAQDGPQVIADGLANPRGVSFDAEGNLYVAEAGVAGPQRTLNMDPYGASAQVTRISPDGSAEVVVRGLISYREGNSLGAHAAQAHGDSLWLLLGETADFSIPFTHALVELDMNNGRVKNYVDLLALELNEDPDGNPNEQSNPIDFAVAADGTVLIANAGCNCLMAWTEADGLSVAAVWDFETDNPVPTSVEIGPDGDIYVGFLTGFPFPQGGSRVERWSGGELVQTYEGLTAVVGLLVTDDGTIYAVEHGTEFVPGEGWAPGRVVMVDESGITPVLEGLTAPFGIAQNPVDGTIVVATNSVGSADGQVVVVQ